MDLLSWKAPPRSDLGWRGALDAFAKDRAVLAGDRGRGDEGHLAGEFGVELEFLSENFGIDTGAALFNFQSANAELGSAARIGFGSRGAQ